MKIQQKAFSLVEVLVVVATLGVVASIAYAAVGDVASKAREEKLSTDLDTLNRAVRVYLASGGSLDSVTTPAEVINRLKSRVSDADAELLPGMSASLIDPRLSYRPSSNGKGVIWDTNLQKFVAGGTGNHAIEEFFFDEALAEVAPAEDKRDATLKYASTSNWIWDYTDKTLPTPPSGATPITLGSSPVSSPPPSGGGGGSGGGGSPSPPPAGTLAAPAYSIVGGTYPIRNYNLPVSLINLNPAGVSKVVYAIDYGPWLDYTAPVSVPPGATLSAQALALTSNWSDSAKLDQYYDAQAASLLPPVITTSSNQFGYFSGTSITVSLSNPNPAGSSELVYRLDGGTWLPYTGPFTVDRSTYPAGVTIEAMAQAPGNPYWTPSSTSLRSLGAAPMELTGTTDGSFSNPIGSSAMITNLTESGIASSSYFDWGDDVKRGGSTGAYKRSSLEFSGLSFSSAIEGQRFQIGQLDYFNGTTYAYDEATGTLRTAAEAVSIGIDIAMSAGGIAFATTFNFNFDLINVINVNDPNDPWADADYVQLSNPTATEILNINGRQFAFQLEFGETTNKGFSTFDEFHVQEWSSASSNLYGTFYEIPATD